MSTHIDTGGVVVGGGPAGLMLAFSPTPLSCIRGSHSSAKPVSTGWSATAAGSPA